jgi:hypothetical protein
MSYFKEKLALEIRRQESIYNTAKSKLASSPEGALTVRQRKQMTSYYLNVESKDTTTRKRKQINITTDKKLILQLIDKFIQKKKLLISKTNLLYLKKLYRHYQSTDLQYIFTFLSPTYQQAITHYQTERIHQLQNKPYPKAPFDPRYHVHETICGEFVRSKSEQIILNTLSLYTLIIHYEEEYIYRIPVDGIGRVYPDFTIILPNGKRSIWEHLGRLDDPEYCYKTALKLNLYQQNGYVLGDNLILTMDDNKGNISSRIILDIIENHILPQVSAATMQPCNQK